MIKAQNCGPKDLLPPQLKNDPDMQAFSYAIEQAMEITLKFKKRSLMYAAIDEQPEYILDYMAAEMRAQYYEETMDRRTKIEIIKNALGWYMMAGTQKSMDELITTVLGIGKTIPWYQTDGEPGTFDIEITSGMKEENYEKFTRLIEKTKNASAHLKTVRSINEETIKSHIGTILANGTFSNMGNDLSEEKETYIQENALLACTAEICECYESLFIRKLASSLPERATSTGTVIQCTLLAELYERTENEQELSTPGRIGSSIGYIQSSVLQERSQELRTMTSSSENGSVLETETVQGLEA